MLYPIKFKPRVKERIWGGKAILERKGKAIGRLAKDKLYGESWDISGLEGNISVVANGFLKKNNLEEIIEVYMGNLIGDKVYEKYGLTFPLLAKTLDCHNILSIQVHPDDALAAERHDSYGKTEMWYVIDAEPGSYIYIGFKDNNITREEFIKSLNEDTLPEKLNKVEVKAGDVFFLPAGRVHAIGKGIFIAEIQQNSNITYRIYDYNRKDKNGNGRELHTELAKDAIDYKLYSDLKTEYTPCVNEGVKLAECQYFSTSVLDIDGEVTYKLADRDSFSIFICMGGKATLTDNEGNVTEMKQGETILVPATTQEVKIEGNAKLLECFIP